MPHPLMNEFHMNERCQYFKTQTLDLIIRLLTIYPITSEGKSLGPIEETAKEKITNLTR